MKDARLKNRVKDNWANKPTARTRIIVELETSYVSEEKRFSHHRVKRIIEINKHQSGQREKEKIVWFLSEGKKVFFFVTVATGKKRHGGIQEEADSHRGVKSSPSSNT